MGRGDNLLGSGLARGAAARGKRIAFGDGRRISWDRHSAEIFWRNPNIAAPGDEWSQDLEWIDFRVGHRIYNRISPDQRRWFFNAEFRPAPGEMFFDDHELEWAAGVGSGFILMEPNVEDWKPQAPSKRWAYRRYDEVAARLKAEGHEIVQFEHGGAHRIPVARLVKAPSFRQALAALARAALYIGPEGGMHHGAAAVGVRGVVIFGGRDHPGATGYAMHANITAGGEPCGANFACPHCLAALDAITVDQVHAAALEQLK